MKKLSMVIVLITAIHFNTKAQNNLPVDAGSKATLAVNTNYSINQYPAISNYMNKDSAAVLKDHAYYKAKSKNFRTAGLVLLSSGLVLSGIGLLVATSNNSGFDNTQTGVTIMGIGALAGIVSIPMMAIAHSYKNKAALLVSTQKTATGIPVLSGKDITGLTLSFRIGK